MTEEELDRLHTIFTTAYAKKYAKKYGGWLGQRAGVRAVIEDIERRKASPKPHCPAIQDGCVTPDLCLQKGECHCAGAPFADRADARPAPVEAEDDLKIAAAMLDKWQPGIWRTWAYDLARYPTHAQRALAMVSKARELLCGNSGITDLEAQLARMMEANERQGATISRMHDELAEAKRVPEATKAMHAMKEGN